MSTDAPKPAEGGVAPGSTGGGGGASSTPPALTTPTPAGTGAEPHEIIIYVTNKQWECRLQEGAPYLENGYQKAIKGDDNPHHWGQKRFQTYDGPGNGLIEIKAGDPQIQFWAHSKNEDRKLTLYWVCKKRHPHENRTIWFIFAPNYSDERQVARGSDFWGWDVNQKFYAKSKVDNWVCEHCTFLNTRVDDECEMCKTAAPPERKSTPIKRGPMIARPPVMARASSMEGPEMGPSINSTATTPHTKHGWWTCIACSGENPPSMLLCEFCGKEEYNPMPPQYVKQLKPEDPSKKPVAAQKGVSESFGVTMPSASTTT